MRPAHEEDRIDDETGHPRPPSSTTSNVVPSDQLSLKKGWWSKFKTSAAHLFTMNAGDWLEDMRGNLSMAASLICAITFQAALNPPGGVVQTSTGVTSTGEISTPIDCNISTSTFDDSYWICTGQAVLAAVYPNDYLSFVRYNTFSFVASLSAALLLVSGIPLRHRFLMWFLSIAMSGSLTSLALTYLGGVLMVIPDPLFGSARRTFKQFMYVWIGLLLLVILFVTISFLVWLVKKIRKLFKCLKNKKDYSRLISSQSRN